jgi:acyl-CoA thioester hydrolase
MNDQFDLFTHPYTILERHLDTFGHVNNATYLQILEEASWEFITARGFGMKKIKETGLGPTILECNIKFMKELCLRQNIVIETQTQSYDRKIGLLKQVMKNEDGEVCAEAIFTIGLFDTRERKLVLPTPEWLYAVGAPVAL